MCLALLQVSCLAQLMPNTMATDAITYILICHGIKFTKGTYQDGEI